MTSPQSQPSPWSHMGKAVSQHFFLKGLGTTVFISLFFAAYFYLLKNPAFPIAVMPRTWADRLIGFAPLALPVYLSLWVYVSLPPLFFSDRRELLRYGLAMALTCLSGLAVFYVWPTAAPPADIDWLKYPDMQFLKSIDAAGNACPSLHVATAVFSGLWLHRMLRGFSVPVWLLGLNALWCAGIAWSTLATRQHVAVDVAAGMVLGGLGAWLSLRLHRQRGGRA